MAEVAAPGQHHGGAGDLDGGGHVLVALRAAGLDEREDSRTRFVEIAKNAARQRR